MTGRHPHDDPPPYVWFDDPAQPFGPVAPVTTIVVGAGLVAVVLVLLGGPEARAARIATGLPIALIAAMITRMGVARRVWRSRHPGKDPMTVAHETGANVGSAFGNDSWTARVARWILVIVAAAICLVCVLALRNTVTQPGAASPLQVVIIVALAALSGWIAWPGGCPARSSCVANAGARGRSASHARLATPVTPGHRP